MPKEMLYLVQKALEFQNICEKEDVTKLKRSIDLICWWVISLYFIQFDMLNLTFCSFFTKTQKHATKLNYSEKYCKQWFYLIHWCNGAYLMITSSNLKTVHSAKFVSFCSQKKVLAGTLLEFNKSVTETYLSLPQLTNLHARFLRMRMLFEKKLKQINKKFIKSSWGLSDEVSHKSGVFDMISVFPDLNH